MATIWDAGSAAPVDTYLITQLALKRRWPRAKWAALKAAAEADLTLADFVESFNLARYIDLQDAETIAGVQTLTDPAVDASIRLTVNEAAAILELPAAESEKP